MKEKIIAHRKLIDIFVIIFVGTFLCIPLLGNVDVYKDDGIQHIARAFGTSLEIKESFFPNVISNFANGFGYSWNLFYGSLTSYSLVIISLLTGNFINAYKIFVYICLFLSGITMYKFMHSLTKNNNASILASILYMTFPYHLTDLYIRNALGEYVSFVFIPLVFLGIYNLFYTDDKLKSPALTIGACGLILTHNISTVLVAFFAMLFVAMNITKLNDKKIKKAFILNVVFIILLTALYWVPLLETLLFADYQVYEDGMMATKESFLESRLDFTQLFVTRNDGSFVFELGPHFMIMFAISLIGFRKTKHRLKEIHIFCVVSAILSIWMSTKLFPWGLFPEEISIIQFSWRLLMMSGFFLSTVCALNVFALIKNFNVKDVLVISVISILYVCAFVGYVVYDDGIKDINTYTLGVLTGKEYEVIAGTAKGEYLPTKAYDNRFYLASRDNDVFTLEGKAVIEDIKKDGTNLTAKIETFDAEYTLFELPYLYYPGYTVRFDGTILDCVETENGFIGFFIPQKDKGTLEVEYTGTKAMGISLLISCITLIVFGIYTIKKEKKPITLEK